MPTGPAAPPVIAVPQAPTVVLGASRGAWLSADGEVTLLGIPGIRERIAGELPLLVHAAAARRRLGVRGLVAFDLLELFAFVLPGRFCMPTPRGLATALGLPLPTSLEAQALSVLDSAAALLEVLAQAPDRLAGDLAGLMTAGGWPWGPSVLQALGRAAGAPPSAGRRALEVWSRLPEWSESGPPDPPGHRPVEPLEARRRLAALVGARSGEAEPRPEQADYASAVTAAFAPRDAPSKPHVVLAEAGTGVGKTLGYLAPASLWAERNGAAVWVSTFTRNLQSQIDAELDRLFPDPDVKRERAVVRKGRENYLCLLNLEEVVRAVGSRLAEAPGLGLVVRWLDVTRDGALVGGDFPGWLVDLLGRALTLGLGDRRGECIYSACRHYTRCFIEHGVRRARRADIVVANHALVMAQAALGGLDDASSPTRYVFDEGHHLFEAADSAFSAHLSGQATADLRRWLLGVGEGSGRGRGLRRRIEGLLAGDETALEDLQAVLVAAAALPAETWQSRLVEGRPRGAIESFLGLVRQQVLARAADQDTAYDFEAERHPLIEDLTPAAAAADLALTLLESPVKRLIQFLRKELDLGADELGSQERVRIEAMIRNLDRRVGWPVAAWRAMLADLPRELPDGMVDWFSITRLEGRELDVGLHRHWIDPTIPFAAAVMAPAHGVVVTSATLTDGRGEVEAGWRTAEARSGAVHLTEPAIRARVASPFDYAVQTRAFVVTDVRREDMDQVADAYRALFLAAGGGALGLFTAIARLKEVHARIAGPMEEAGLPLLAQHVDGLDTGTLVDIFRAEEDACLLGTDAVRDGVDVPGRSLRLIVFDRVPWPRRQILHKARRAAFGGSAYDDMLVRLKLRQAFGRLIRRAGDTGVFVMLDRMLPSRLADCLPEGVVLRRLGLAEAVAETRSFLAPADQPLASAGIPL